MTMLGYHCLRVTLLGVPCLHALSFFVSYLCFILGRDNSSATSSSRSSSSAVRTAPKGMKVSMHIAPNGFELTLPAMHTSVVMQLQTAYPLVHAWGGPGDHIHVFYEGCTICFPQEKGVLLLRDIRDALDLGMRSPKGICSKKKDPTPEVVIFAQKTCRY